MEIQDPNRSQDRVTALALVLPATGVLAGSLLLFNAAQLVSLVVYPFSKRRFRAFNRWAADTYWKLCVDLARKIHGTHIVTTGDVLPGDENAILIANHQEMADIAYLLFLARDSQRLGDMKWVAKKVIKHVPGVGWGLRFLDTVFLDRKWMKDRARVAKAFHKLVEETVPVWLVWFPEGTRLTAAKLDSSKAYARSRSLPEFDHVLLPRTKGFVAAVEGLRGHVSAVYDLTIGYEGTPPTLWDFVRGRSRRAHIHVRRFSLEALPEDPEELGQWLLERFAEKDRLLGFFRRHGRFPDRDEELAVIERQASPGESRQR